jgi:hypothetical protein
MTFSRKCRIIDIINGDMNYPLPLLLSLKIEVVIPKCRSISLPCDIITGGSIFFHVSPIVFPLVLVLVAPLSDIRSGNPSKPPHRPRAGFPNSHQPHVIV